MSVPPRKRFTIKIDTELSRFLSVVRRHREISERISVSCFVVTRGEGCAVPPRWQSRRETRSSWGIFPFTSFDAARVGRNAGGIAIYGAVRRGQNLHGSPRRLRRSSSRPVQLARLLALRSTAMSAPSVWCAARRERAAGRGRGAARRQRRCRSDRRLRLSWLNRLPYRRFR